MHGPGFREDVKTLKRTFCNAKDFNQPINSWDVSSVTTMEETFYSERPDFTGIRTTLGGSNAHLISGIPEGSDKEDYFRNLIRMDVNDLGKHSHFNQPLNEWITSSVETMEGMFHNAYRFNQDISNWDVSACKNMAAML